MNERAGLRLWFRPSVTGLRAESSLSELMRMESCFQGAKMPQQSRFTLETIPASPEESTSFYLKG